MLIGEIVIWLVIACSMNETYEERVVSTQVYNIQSKISDMGSTDWSYPASTMVPVYVDESMEFQTAQQRFSAKDFSKTAEILLAIIDADPKHIGAHSLLSATFLNMGEYEKAQSAANTVLEIYPSALAHCNIAAVLLAANHHDSAQEHFKKALLLDSKSFLALRNLASLTHRSGELVQSEEYLRRLLRLEPNDSYIYVSLGQVVAEQGRLSEAEEIYRYRLQELEFVDDGTRRTDSGLTLELPLALGEVLSRQEKWEESRRWFEQTIEWSSIYDASWTLPEMYAVQSMLRIAKTYTLQDMPDRAEIEVQRAEKVFYAIDKTNSRVDHLLETRHFVEERQRALTK